MYILPKPQHLSETAGVFTIPYCGEITLDADTAELAYTAAKLLRDEVSVRLGFKLKIKRSFSTDGCVIALKRDSDGCEQGYRLSITRKNICITAKEDIGLLYGVQSLRQIIAQKGAALPCLDIIDYPSIKNRGFFHDATRGRVQKLFGYKQLADTAAYYKLNQLQLYIEHTYLFKGFSEVCRDDTPLTASDIMELDDYCTSIGIDLIPSVASFGHLDKVLKTRSFSPLCELPDAEKEPFTFEGRMEHHTLDVSQENSFAFIQKMLDEFIPLFRSKYFNINGDETFDLGKGKSKELAEAMGIHELYVSVINRICEFVKLRGKRPMFWGDIIIESPELMKKLPSDVICLNWGYSDLETETNAKKMHDVGAVQYMCPGVQGWRRFINRLDLAYENIRRMCSYAEKYEAIGILNTDWGDYGHINDPDFSIPGLIYGASFSWNFKQDEKELLNKKISAVEYLDESERIVSLVSELAMQEGWTWGDAVRYMEADLSSEPKKAKLEIIRESSFMQCTEYNKRIDELMEMLSNLSYSLDPLKRNVIYKYLVSAKLQKLFNLTLQILSKRVYNEEQSDSNNCFENQTKQCVDHSIESYIDSRSKSCLAHNSKNKIVDQRNTELKQEVKLGQEKKHAAEQKSTEESELAEALELAFLNYKDLWRENNRESELYRVQAVVFYYADLLRSLA